jgi:hypothetical protein
MAGLHGSERLGSFADRVSLEHVEAFVTAHVTLTRAELARVFCAGQGGC